MQPDRTIFPMNSPNHSTDLLSSLKTPQALALIGANTAPLLGVWFFGWDVFTFVLLYWLENVFVGLFTVVKIVLAGLFFVPKDLDTPDTKAAIGIGRAFTCLFMVPFFMFHYGLFTFVHGVFVFALFREGSSVDSPSSLIFDGIGSELTLSLLAAIGVLLLEHGFHFARDFVGGRKYQTTNPMMAMARPYPRIIVLHLAILFGALPILLLSLPSASLVILIVLKTAVDLALLRLGK